MTIPIDDHITGIIIILGIIWGGAIAVGVFLVGLAALPLRKTKQPPYPVNVYDEIIRRERLDLARATDLTIFKLRTTGLALRDALVAQGYPECTDELHEFENALYGYVGGDGQWHVQR